MHPVLKRILVHGLLTAGLLAVMGVVFAEVATNWAGSAADGRSAEPIEPAVPDDVRLNVPLMMAFWGFVFVAMSELVLWRLRGNRTAAPPVEKQPDETEKLLNELLARAEAVRVAEGQGAESQKGQEQKPEGQKVG
jgi:hypothetical protein